MSYTDYGLNYVEVYQQYPAMNASGSNIAWVHQKSCNVRLVCAKGSEYANAPGGEGIFKIVWRGNHYIAQGKWSPGSDWDGNLLTMNAQFFEWCYPHQYYVGGYDTKKNLEFSPGAVTLYVTADRRTFDAWGAGWTYWPNTVLWNNSANPFKRKNEWKGEAYVAPGGSYLIIYSDSAPDYMHNVQ